MKRLVNLIFIFIIAIVFIPNTYALNNVEIESISLVEKSDDVLELSKPSIKDLDIGFDLSFVNVGDYAKYKVEIKNNSSKDYYFNQENKFSTSDYIGYTYEFLEITDKIKANSSIVMYITLKYSNKVPENKLNNYIYTEDNNMSINLSDVLLTNPSTYTNYLIVFIILLLVLGYIVYDIKTKKKVGVNIVLLILLLIPIGIHALENITIRVSTKVLIEEKKLNIHLENVLVTNGSVSASTPTINTTGDTVTYSVILNNPGDFYEFTVDAKNDELIDGMIRSVSSTLNGSEITTLPAALSYSLTYSDGSEILNNHLLPADSKVTYKLRVEYRTDISAADLLDTEQTLNFAFTVKYVQADEHAIKRPITVCRRATTLHSAYCANEPSQGYYCGSAGFYNQTIYYGSLGTTGELNPGDAFDCDVNDDGIYDPTTERFYYVSPKDADNSSDEVVLIFFSNVENGNINTEYKTSYSNEISGPNDALNHLPSKEQWKNKYLNTNMERQIKNNRGGNTIYHDGDKYNLPVFTYTNRAARLLSLQELKFACGTRETDQIGFSDGYLDSCNYLMENTAYDFDYHSYPQGFWLETWSDSYFYVYITFGSRDISTTHYRDINRVAIRPAIELKKEYLAY